MKFGVQLLTHWVPTKNELSCDTKDWQLENWDWKLCEKWKCERWPKEYGKHDVKGENKELEYDSKNEMKWVEKLLRCTAGK